jgi:hypothetical protein
MQPYKQPTSAPVPKVTAVGISGIVVTALALLGSVVGITLPTSVTDNVGALITGITALVSLIHFGVGYFTHDTKPAPLAPGGILNGVGQLASAGRNIEGALAQMQAQNGTTTTVARDKLAAQVDPERPLILPIPPEIPAV